MDGSIASERCQSAPAEWRTSHIGFRRSAGSQSLAGDHGRVTHFSWCINVLRGLGVAPQLPSCLEKVKAAGSVFLIDQKYANDNVFDSVASGVRVVRPAEDAHEEMLTSRPVFAMFVPPECGGAHRCGSVAAWLLVPEMHVETSRVKDARDNVLSRPTNCARI